MAVNDIATYVWDRGLLAKMPASNLAVSTPVSKTARERAADRHQLLALAKERKMALYWIAVTVLLYLDTMATYFSKTLIGTIFPYSAIILVLFVFGVFLVGYPRLRLPRYGYVAAYLLVLPFSVAILALDDVDLNRFRDLVSAIVAFAVGYAVITSAKTGKHLQNALFFVGSFYAVVCFIAVRHLYPALFPVVNAVGIRNGQWIFRPEVTTDQNFQIFYLLPIVLVIAIRQTTPRLLAVLFLSAVSAYVLSELQTRSGSLVFGATLAMAAMVGMYSRGKVDYRLIAIAVLGLLGSLLMLNEIIFIFSNLIERFTVSDFDTFEGRTDAFFFTFKHLFDVKWWVPQGYHYYKEFTGVGKPHSNITAVFVESGIVGMIGWVLAVVVPLIALGFRWLKKKTDPIADVVLCGGVSALVVQLSLNAALVQLVWFWSGAVMAALMRGETSAANQPAAALAGAHGTGKERDAVTPQVDERPDRGLTPNEASPTKVPAPKKHASNLRKIEIDDRLRQPSSSLVKPPSRTLKRPLGSLKRRTPEE